MVCQGTDLGASFTQGGLREIISKNLISYQLVSLVAFLI